jgi:uncharacterized DUF497 family protein
MLIFGSDGFDWDSANRTKCGKHGVLADDIEAVFLNNPLVLQDIQHSVAEDRLIAVGEGRTRRPIFVVFTMRMQGRYKLIRPVSARYMHSKEFKNYVQASSHIQDR